jgi:fucose permease
MITSWIFFAPAVYFFFRIVYANDLITKADYLAGIPLGLALNIIGVFKFIAWLKNKNTPYIFEQRNLLPQDRKAIR